MDKRTILAIFLSFLVLWVGALIQQRFFPQEERIFPENAAPVGVDETQMVELDAESITEPITVAHFALEPLPIDAEIDGKQLSEQYYDYELEDFMQYRFDIYGGNIINVKLMEFEDNGAPLDFFLKSDANVMGIYTDFGVPLDTVFAVKTEQNAVIFSRRFVEVHNANEISENSNIITIVKRYEFMPDEYLVRMQIDIRGSSVNEALPLGTENELYSISIGPQIGPQIEVLDGRYDFRNFLYYKDSKRKKQKMKIGETQSVSGFSWVAIEGKYFAFIARAVNIPVRAQLNSQILPEGYTSAYMRLERPYVRTNTRSDEFYFYMGPKRSAALKKYNNASDNKFGLMDMHIDKIIKSNILSWLSTILKAMLEFLYIYVKNWGIAIILVTIFVKILFYPLTFKSSQSMAKMQDLTPKMDVLRKKYEKTPEKLQAAMMDLYKTEGINPLSGCWPMLLQMPVLFAMYGLFNNYFEFRGALFIPGWITDLSRPEVVISFPFIIPILGWSGLHGLPFLFLLTQLISGKLMSNPSASANQMQAQMMVYGMPIFLFFILYSVPSGLLLYWIVQNIITIIQQQYIKSKLHKKE